MKKTILFLVLMTVLTSCIGESDRIRKAKQELGVIEKDLIGQVDGKEVKDEIPKEKKGEEVNVKNPDPRIRITQLSGKKVLLLDDLKYSDFKGGNVKITGVTISEKIVDSITVSFSNTSSEFPDDTFTLEKFKPSAKKFEYNANSRFSVLDFGLNIYLFTAKFGKEISVLQLEVIVSENDDKTIDGKKMEKKEKEKNEKSGDEAQENKYIGNLGENLPEGGDFGYVVKIGEEKVTYSGIKGLEIKKMNSEYINCEKDPETDKYYITKFLADTQKSWYYWNTCRDIIKGEGISFFVTRLDGDNYIYEKHYLGTKKGIYGIYELETGGDATSKNLGETNKNMKQKNGEFIQLKIVNSLFRKIVK